MPASAVLQPLVSSIRIVNDDGTPNAYFIRWAQQRQLDIQDGITLEQAQQLIDDWAASRHVTAGDGLTGGGSLAADIELALADSGVTPGTYGDATHVAQVTVDEFGRVTAVALVEITGGGGGGAGGILPVVNGDVPPVLLYDDDGNLIFAEIY